MEAIVVNSIYFCWLLWVPVMNQEYDDMNTTQFTCSRIILPSFWTGNSSINYTYWPEIELEPYVPYQYEVFGYLYLAIIILGCIGNVLIVVVFCKNRASYPSISVYLSALAISDTVTILTHDVETFVCETYNILFTNFSELACKLVPFLSDVSKLSSSWILVAVTIKRVITVMYPLKIKYMCTSNIAKIAVIAIWMVSCGKESHIFYGSVYQRNYGYCNDIDEDYAHFIYEVDTWLDIVFIFAVPFCIISFGNILIICKLMKNASKRRKMTSSSVNREREE